MNRQTLFALGAVAATCLSTMLAYAPIMRYLSAIGGEPFAYAKHLFASQVLPSLAIGLALVVLTLCLAARKPILAIAVLVAAPIAVIASDLFVFMHS